MALREGQRLGELTVVAPIGEGSHAAIYKVRHDDGTRAALKVLHTTDPVAKERLAREGRALAELKHPNVVQLFGSLEVDARPALLMELVAGPTLADWMDAGGARGIDEALDLFRGIARGVQAVHSVGLVHRDLNPGNILLSISASKRVVPKLVDFGLVRLPDAPGLTRPGAMGTPAYMAPEQTVDGRKASARSDLYALGCILYELVAHERAFQGADTLSLYQAAREEAYLPLQTVRPEVPDYVGDVVTQLLRADPEARFESVAEVLETLYLDDVPDVTEDVVPEVFQVWSEARVSTATAAAVREMAPAQTVPAVPRAVEPETPAATLPRGAVVGLGIGGLLGLCLGLLLAWWVLA
jgi:serine/threonine-protein kinase